jgi:hypothetical protein
MEPYNENFQEYLILKQHSRSTGVSIGTLIHFKDRAFRYHLVALHDSGSPLSEVAEYIAAFHGIEVTPQQLRKILQKSEPTAWTEAALNYRQHRAMRQHQALLSTIGG